MGYLGAALRQVFMRVRRADVSLRDVTIAQRGNGGYWVQMTTRTGSARRIWEDFEKVSELRIDTGRVEMKPASEETVGFSMLAENFVAGAKGVGWGWRQMKKTE